MISEIEQEPRSCGQVSYVAPTLELAFVACVVFCLDAADRLAVLELLASELAELPA